MEQHCLEGGVEGRKRVGQNEAEIGKGSENGREAESVAESGREGDSD